MSYAKDQIKRALQKKNYAWFEKGDYNLNIVGIRNSHTGNRSTNKFDDVICVYYKVGGMWKDECFGATTDPGSHWLVNLLNPNGTAILVPGQYRGAYQIGLHQGKYSALVQAKPVKVFRDKDRDLDYDKDPRYIQTGFFGINIHRASKHTVSRLVDRWSAGCQVIASPTDFSRFMNICRKAFNRWGNSFTYTLIESKDIN